MGTSENKLTSLAAKDDDSVAKGEKRTYYPTLYISKDIGLEQEDVGKDMIITLKAKVVCVTKDSCYMKALSINLGR